MTHADWPARDPEAARRSRTALRKGDVDRLLKALAERPDMRARIVLADGTAVELERRPDQPLTPRKAVVL